MKVKKITINQDLPLLNSYTKNNDFLYHLYYPQQANNLVINLVEIETNENPSDFISLIKKGDEEKVIPLYLYKTTMAFMGNKFCWDVKDNEDFVLTPWIFLLGSKEK